jgi:hypothetical protein
MTENEKRFSNVIAAIDAINIEDPNQTTIEDTVFPNELLYSQRMTGILEQYYPDAEELLIIAARGQHIKRWLMPREDYPEGKAGYHKWRRELAEHHSQMLSEIMADNGYAESEIVQVQRMILKKDLKTDHDSQVLQDVVSLVFLRYYANDFIAKHPDKNVSEIMGKMVKKISPEGLAKAKEICPENIVKALESL